MGVFGAGRREGAQHPRDHGSEPSSRHEREAFATRRVLVSELHRQATPEGMAEEGRALDLERDHEVVKHVGEAPERVVVTRFAGFSVSEQVRATTL
jgi:hypothetical protein